jgi:hypothetical protein
VEQREHSILSAWKASLLFALEILAFFHTQFSFVYSLIFRS